MIVTAITKKINLHARIITFNLFEVQLQHHALTKLDCTATTVQNFSSRAITAQQFSSS